MCKVSNAFLLCVGFWLCIDSIRRLCFIYFTMENRLCWLLYRSQSTLFLRYLIPSQSHSFGNQGVQVVCLLVCLFLAPRGYLNIAFRVVSLLLQYPYQSQVKVRQLFSSVCTQILLQICKKVKKALFPSIVDEWLGVLLTGLLIRQFNFRRAPEGPDGEIKTTGPGTQGSTLKQFQLLAGREINKPGRILAKREIWGYIGIWKGGISA